MPKTTKSGTAKKDELPSTLRRSSGKAQRTFAKAHDSAAEQYGSEERAHRVAYAAVKDSFEKVGDHWEAKAQQGPSDKHAERGGLHNPCRRPKALTPTPARSICSRLRVGSISAGDQR